MKESWKAVLRTCSMYLKLNDQNENQRMIKTTGGPLSVPPVVRSQRPRCKHTGHQTGNDASIGVFDPRGNNKGKAAGFSGYLQVRR